MSAQKSEDGVGDMTELPGFLAPSAGSLRTLPEVTAVDIAVRAVGRPALNTSRRIEHEVREVVYKLRALEALSTILPAAAGGATRKTRGREDRSPWSAIDARRKPAVERAGPTQEVLGERTNRERHLEFTRQYQDMSEDFRKKIVWADESQFQRSGPNRKPKTCSVSLLASPTSNRVESPAGSLPDFHMWESCQMVPLVGGFSLESPFSPTTLFWCCSMLTSITAIVSQDLAVPIKLFTNPNNINMPNPLIFIHRGQFSTGSPSDFRMRASCRTMSLVGGFSRGSPISPNLSSRRSFILTSITLIGSQYLAVTCRHILFTHSVGNPR
ncbi:hypothetical protein PR048_019263 [Dryococelus australis]|uniref:Uncharacterized protein n=1 Tax=Dryococelus australis TaxID=614101 RepID=A0ABQ9H399_9NEOP|nr:hypothetical protein PR048_019263 [Dryococelus australis]